jgi:spermidine synthase
VDIDSRVTEVCKKFFPEMVKSFEDERVSLINQDGREYLSATQEVYDIIFVDSTDPTGPGISLVKEDFLLLGSRRLSSPFGIWVAQTESTMPKTSFLSNYVKVLRKEYPIVKVYQTDVPSYGGGWTFTFASKKTNPLECKRKAPSGLFYYNEEIHKAAFVLPEYLRKELE